MDSALFQALAAGLSLWASKEKTKYIDRLERAKRAWDEEYKKPIDQRSDAVLDDIRFDLKILTASFSDSVKNAR